jgi:hypothetical protein
VRPRRRGGSESGQGTVEWIALIFLVSLLVLALGAAVGVGLPGTELVKALASRLVCAVGLDGSCDPQETRLASAYGDEVAALVSEDAPTILYEPGMRALPVDYRRCREDACAEGAEEGEAWRSRTGEPTVAFVRVVDCRVGSTTAGANCSGARAGNLYLQYWLYYVDSATMRGVPLVGSGGYHRDDWESVQVRIGPAGGVDERASSHHGYNHAAGPANAGAEAGIDVLRGLAEALGARPRNGWGPSEGLLRVSGGSHASSAEGYFELDRIAPGPSVHLVALEPIAAAGRPYRFAVTPPWRKRAWTDPEASGTD